MASQDTKRAGTFLDYLGSADVEALLACGRAHTWAGGELLMRAGAPADSAIVISEGVAKVELTAASGRQVIITLCGPGDLLGEPAVFDATVRSATVTAMQPVTGVVISRSALRTFISQHPRAALALLDLVLVRLHVADAQRQAFATSGSLERVAGQLCELADRFGTPVDSGAVEISLPITQAELASWAGASNESTSRALRTLRQLGLIETGRLTIRVHDLAGLRTHAAAL